MSTYFSRRSFLRVVAAAWAGSLLAGSTRVDARGRRRNAAGSFHEKPRRVLADLHIHLGVDEWNRRTPLAIRYPVLMDLVERHVNITGYDWGACHDAGIDLLVAAHFNVFDEWVSMATDPYPHATANLHRMMDYLEEELEGPAKPYAVLAREPKDLARLDIQKSDPDYRVVVLHGVEGGHALGEDLRALEGFARRGVAVLCITHFFHKAIGSASNSYPYFPDAGARLPSGGLSEFGAEVVSEMQRLGIIVDISHASADTVADVLNKTRKPIIASHTCARALADHPYCLYDEHVQEISRRGGLIGVIVYPYLLSNYATLEHARSFGGLRDVVRTIRYVTKICGTHKTVAIGSDFAGYIQGPRDMLRIEHINRLRTLLIDEFQDVQVVEDIMSNNAIEFLRLNWGSQG
jgi:membrane dipeptidase